MVIDGLGFTMELAGFGGFGALGSSDSFLVGGSALLSEELRTTERKSVRVQADHDTQVLERVLLLAAASVRDLLGVDDGLDFIGVDETGEVRVGHARAWESVVGLLGRSTVGGSPDAVELVESILGPDDETSHVSSRGELQQVEAFNLASFDTRKIAESLGDTIVRVVDNERTTTLDVTTVTEFTLTTSQFLGVLGLFGVSQSTSFGEGFEGSLGLLDRFNRVVDNTWDLSNRVDSVTTSHNQRWKGGGGQSGSDSISLLVDVNLSVPLSPSFGWGEHATFTTHVTESGLTGTRSTTTRNTRNTRDSATSTPRVGRVLHTSIRTDSVRLTGILAHVSVNKSHDVWADRGQEHRRHDNLLGGIFANDGDERAGGSH